MKSKIISFVMAILFIIVFGIFIYPGIYKYDKLNQNIPVKINRFTGSTQILTVNGWKSATVPIVDNVSEPTDKGTSINAGESIAINLSTDDYNMTSKYKSYELKVIQDKNIDYFNKRRKELGIK